VSRRSVTIKLGLEGAPFQVLVLHVVSGRLDLSVPIVQPHLIPQQDSNVFEPVAARTHLLLLKDEVVALD